MIDLNGKIAIVTGGAGGIGSAICATLAAAGAHVTATGIDSAEIERAANDPMLTGIALEPLDVGDDNAVKALTERFDAVDILVNCAGTTSRGPAAFEEGAFEHVIDINLMGTMRMCRAFRSLLGGTGNGAIVNIASMMSFVGSGTAPGYAASKGGVAQLTKSLAIAWATENIRVNAVAPGWIITPLTERQIDPELRARVAARTPMGRWGSPEHIADAVAFLSSSRAAFVTGIILPVDGGYLAA